VGAQEPECRVLSGLAARAAQHTASSPGFGRWILPGRLFGRQAGYRRLDGVLEFGQVVVDGGLQDREVCVEVPVGQMSAHTRDLGPGDAGLGVEQVSGQCLDGFRDFQQADADGVRYQSV
jgi:hypothetical protein